MQYFIDFQSIMLQLTPPFLKKERLLALWSVFSSSLTYIHELFESYSNVTSFELKYNGQTICLQQILNAKFPYSLPIFITDSLDELPYVYIFLNQEVIIEEHYIYTNTETADELYLHTNEEYNAIDDFYVYVPQLLYDELNAEGKLPLFNSIIQKRKIVGKSYTIKTY